MTLDGILLGILRTPAAGYDIKRAFDEVFTHFWSADLAQIYRALNRMEKDGWLTSRVEPSDKGPARKVYSRTEAGRRVFNDWLSDGPVIGTEKFSYLAQVFFLGNADDPTLSESFFMTLRDQLLIQRETLAAIEQGWKNEAGEGFPDALDGEDFHAWLTLDMGLRKTGALVEWADEALMRLKQRANGGTGK